MSSYRLNLKINFKVPVSLPFTVNISIAETGKYSCRLCLIKHHKTVSITGYVYLAPAVQSKQLPCITHLVWSWWLPNALQSS